MPRLCWSEYEEWLEEQYTEARERGLECIATRYGIVLFYNREYNCGVDGTSVEEHDKPEGLSDKPGRC